MKDKLPLITSIFAGLLVFLAFSAGSIFAKPRANRSQTFSLPETARKVAPNVYYLGAVPHDGRLAEGYAFVDNRGRNAKPGTECGNGVCEPGENANKCPADCGGGDGGDGGSGTSSCYGFLASGAKWKTLEPWIVNTSNSRSLSSTSVFSSLDASIAEWEDAADGAVDGVEGYDILGSGSTTGETLVANTGSPDDKNEVYFADIGSDGAIGVTIVWGYFRGNPAWRELIEWDQIYDDVDFDWSEDCTAEDCTSEGNKKMDFPNIAIHELGHSVGLDDLYDEKCSEMTMYGYGAYGETKKSDLEDGDINGISELYN